MKNIAVLSVGRSDYSILLPVMRKINAHENLNLHLLVAGMHLAHEFGMTVNNIIDDGWEIKERIEHNLASDTPAGLAKSIGLGVIGFADLFSRYAPDILLLVGDRFEVMAAALAAQPFSFPIAHIHGGETSQGAIDEVFRHSITKMSHIHFATTKIYRDRIIQLGEQPDTVFVSGAPALDYLATFHATSFEDLKKNLNMNLTDSPIVVTYHPETIHFSKNESNLREIVNALASVSRPVIFTGSNADTTGRRMNAIIDEATKNNPNFFFKNNLGTDGYYNLLSHSFAMLGNSSSGIIEAMSFKLPVINLGDRQRGRVQGSNVINTTCSSFDILKAIEKISNKDFLDKIMANENPYFSGGASDCIVDVLAKYPVENVKKIKEFRDMKKLFERISDG